MALLVTFTLVTAFVGGFVLAAAGWTEASPSVDAGLLVLTAILLFPAYALSIKRANDLDLPAWTIWVMMAVTVTDAIFTYLGWARLAGPLMIAHTVAVVLVALCGTIIPGFIRGTVGPNRHGPDTVEAGPAAAT